jgi:O-acetyl-ADP-ribose deacetylase (regulator of RNase III)
MIKVVNGNLLDATENIIGHQVNCQATMASGIAKQIRARYPTVYDKYVEASNKLHPVERLGTCQIVKVDNNKYVANLFGQLYYGREKNVVYTNYIALEAALSQLKGLAETQGLSVALPWRIGCGLANGNWDDIVYPMLHNIFLDYDLTLYKMEE